MTIKIDEIFSRSLDAKYYALSAAAVIKALKEFPLRIQNLGVSSTAKVSANFHISNAQTSSIESVLLEKLFNVQSGSQTSSLGNASGLGYSSGFGTSSGLSTNSSFSPRLTNSIPANLQNLITSIIGENKVPIVFSTLSPSVVDILTKNDVLLTPAPSAVNISDKGKAKTNIGFEMRTSQPNRVGTQTPKSLATNTLVLTVKNITVMENGAINLSSITENKRILPQSASTALPKREPANTDTLPPKKTTSSSTSNEPILAKNQLLLRSLADKYLGRLNKPEFSFGQNLRQLNKASLSLESFLKTFPDPNLAGLNKLVKIFFEAIEKGNLLTNKGANSQTKQIANKLKQFSQSSERLIYRQGEWQQNKVSSAGSSNNTIRSTSSTSLSNSASPTSSAPSQPQRLILESGRLQNNNLSNTNITLDKLTNHKEGVRHSLKEAEHHSQTVKALIQNNSKLSLIKIQNTIRPLLINPPSITATLANSIGDKPLIESITRLIDQNVIQQFNQLLDKGLTSGNGNEIEKATTKLLNLIMQRLSENKSGLAKTVSTSLSKSLSKSISLYVREQLNFNYAQELNRSVSNSLSNIEHQQLTSLKLEQPPIQHLLFDLPFKNGQQIDSFQLQFEQETNRAKKQVKSWKVTVRFDLDKLGPMFARIEMTNNKISSHLFAKNQSTVRLLNENIPILKKSLSETGLDVQSVTGAVDREKTNTNPTPKTGIDTHV